MDIIKCVQNFIPETDSPEKIYELFREQKPNPLPDRKAPDDIVLDIFGLTEGERTEVYWAVCELVKNRLDKARSV